MVPRKRRVFSIARELLSKSQDAALTAIQVFNNPLVNFKSETFIVLMTIAWTYLLHAYYRKEGVEYRYYDQGPKRRRFKRTKDGSYKYWELRQCLQDDKCPLDNETKKNLLFLLGLRNEIEHHMSPNLDNYLSARYQACCLNYNEYIKRLFGEQYGIDQFMTYSLQFAQLSEEQLSGPADDDVPVNVKAYIARFDEQLAPEELNSPRFAYRVLFVRKVVGKPGQADRVIEFVSPDTELAKTINKDYWVLKETERTKYLPGQIVEMMREEGFVRFNMYHHTQLWKRLDGKNPGKGLGTPVARRTWHWYERWVDLVRKHCIENRDRYLGESQ